MNTYTLSNGGSVKKTAIIISYFLLSVISLVPVFSQTGRNLKRASIDMKNQRIARYWVTKKRYEEVPEVVQPVALIDLIEDILELQPVTNGYIKGSKRHHYGIMCTSQTQMHTAEFVDILVGKGLFIIPAIGTIIGTIGGVSYRLESIKKVKATLKNPEQIALVLSIKH